MCDMLAVSMLVVLGLFIDFLFYGVCTHEMITKKGMKGEKNFVM